MQVLTKNIVWSNYLSAPLAQFLLNQNSRGTAVGSRPSTRPSPRSRCPRTCEPPARRPRAPARMSSRLTGGCRLRGMHDRWPWGPSRRSWRLGTALPRRNHPGSREVLLGPRPRDKLHSLSSGHIVLASCYIYFSSAKNQRLPEGGGQWPRTSISTEMRAAIPIPRIPIS